MRIRRILVLGVLALIVHGATWAQPPADKTELDQRIYRALRDVINAGARLYNRPSNDHNGCYRLYEGSLMTLRPLLEHRPNLQKAIDDAFAGAERETSVAERAFILRTAIDRIREETGGKKGDKETTKKADKKPVEKKESDKKAPEKKEPEKKGLEKKEPEKKKEVEKNVEAPASVQGNLTLDGQPLNGAKVTFSPANAKTGKGSFAQTKADGSYEIKDGVPPGEYKVLVTAAGTKLPAVYGDADKTPLRVTVKSGKNNFDLDLKTP